MLYAKSFQERDTDLPDTDRELGFLRELDLALYLDTFRRAGTQVGHLATVVPRRQFAVSERIVQLRRIVENCNIVIIVIVIILRRQSPES